MNKHYIRTPRVEHERKVYGINKITMASKSQMNVFAIGVKLAILALI